MNLSSTHDFGSLRSLLQQPASPQLWEIVSGLVTTWPDADERDGLIAPYALEHVRKWPSWMRKIPKGWLEGLHRESISEAVFSLGAVVDYTFYMYDRLTCSDVAQVLAQHPFGRYVEGLWLNSEVPGAIGDVFGPLKTSPHLNQMHALSVAMESQDVAYAKHCLARDRAPLTHFMLKRGNLSFLRWMDWLLDLGRGNQLKQLCFVDQRLGARPSEMEALFDWDGWCNLERFHLFACFEGMEVGHFLHTLLVHEHAPLLSRLTVLDLGANEMEDHHLGFIARSSNLRALRVLAVHLNMISSRGLFGLLDGHLPSLEMVIAPPEAIDERTQRMFEQHGVVLIASNDPRPLVNTMDYWFK